MSSWTMCPCCGRMIGVRRDGAFRVHARNGSECPGSNRTITQILRRPASQRQDGAQQQERLLKDCECGGTLPHPDCPVHNTATEES